MAIMFSDFMDCFRPSVLWEEQTRFIFMLLKIMIICFRSHLNDFDINLSFEIDFIPLSGKDPVKILDDKYLTVTSFLFSTGFPAYGFLFREKRSERNIIKECIDKYKIPTGQNSCYQKRRRFYYFRWAVNKK